MGASVRAGAEAVFVGSGIFKSDNPSARAKAIADIIEQARSQATIFG